MKKFNNYCNALKNLHDINLYLEPHSQLILDGGMGTQLIDRGLKPGELPELWNITRSEDIIQIHLDYLQSGSNVILTNTFGVNRLKFKDSSYSIEEIIKSAVTNAQEAIRRYSTTNDHIYVALDIGSLGVLLEPLGELSFDDAYEYFKEIILHGVEAGVDLIYIETMTDLYELKAAILAAKENSSLPIFTTVTFDDNHRLLTGADIPTVVAVLEGLRVDALGVNCGLGPVEMLPIVNELARYTSLPIIVKPNAGLPQLVDGETVFDFEPELFAEAMQQLVEAGASIVGGCCGTTPEHIRAVKHGVQFLSKNRIIDVDFQDSTIVTSNSQAVIFEEKPLIIGERINPTGKKLMKEALKQRDISYILSLAMQQEHSGAHILDVNVGLPEINELEMMEYVVKQLQQVSNLPLQIDSVDVATLDRAMRIYNGKPLVNSVNGTKESMEQVFPLIAQYGGVVIGLTLDEDGIPADADGRVRIARHIIQTACTYGIHKKDIIIDVLSLTISSNPEGAKVTLEAMKRVREELGVHTTLGVSNISFGLPNRPIINSNFYTMALQYGLSAGIINPSSEEMMRSYHAFLALNQMDENCMNYISKYAQVDHTKSDQTSDSSTLPFYILRGLKEDAKKETEVLTHTMDGLAIIDSYIIPTLNQVGEDYESGRSFLPQLLMSAEAAKLAFEVIKEQFPADETQKEKPKIVLATVKGDIHDIGKNIVSVILSNYGYQVIDLGKDVPPEVIVDCVISEHVLLVGLSALMTTTVTNMKATIELLRVKAPNCKVMVGGAVLNKAYADQIGADFYAKDAMQGVHYAKSVL